MGDKVESEHSCSEESSSLTDSSSGSSEVEEEAMEPVRILGQTLELPQDLCEDYDLFKEFFSIKTWDALSDEQKEHLLDYLPKFSDNEKEEKDKTIKMLFNHEPFHFTSPFGHFFKNLKNGNYRPDIAKMRKFLRKARAKQQRHRRKRYYARLLPELLVSRERLLAVVKGLPPGPVPMLPMLGPRPSSKNKFKPLYQRVKQRYFEELAAIKSEVGGDESDDENYIDGPPELLRKKKSTCGSQTDGNISGTLSGTDSSSIASVDCLKKVLSVHKTRRQYRENHPELNIAGITLTDIKQRVALVNGAKKLMFGGQKSDAPVQKLKRGPKKETGAKQGKVSEGKGAKKKENPVDSIEDRPLLPNIKLKCEPEESDSESSSFVDPVSSPRQGKKSFEPVEIKEEIIDNSINYEDTDLETVIKEEPLDPMMVMSTSRPIQHVPIKLEDLDGIDMMALPVEIADESGEVMSMDSSSQDVQEESVLDPDEALTETTHANFLSLVRALFPARAAHRASKQQLQARCAAVMRSPIAPLNTWYSLSEDWCAELESALSFLAGERGPHPDDFVPYLQFMPDTQMYQWIGAGRDCDALLGKLCERWLHSALVTEATAPTMPTAPPTAPTTQAVAATNAPAHTPKPPKYPTSWSVRLPTATEVLEFRTQERKRFNSPTKPFTYVLHGYRAVVGPCVSRMVGAGGAACASRPRAATLPALVRDAVARLPNGQGSLDHILTLLKMSQWIAPSSEQSLISSVTSLLDRMLAAKRDPFVKYDQKTATWTYMYRHRSEEDWLKTSTGRSRVTKTIASVAPALPTTSPLPTPTLPTATPPAPTPPAPTLATPTLATPTLAALPTLATLPTPPPSRTSLHSPRSPHTGTQTIDMEVANVEEIVDNGSDTDVDVDDSSSPTSVQHLSSAQLLMQATQSLGKMQMPSNKTKGKLVAVSPKSKVKQAAQTKQTVQPKTAPVQAKPAQTTAKTTAAKVLAQTKPAAQAKQAVVQTKQASSLSPKQTTSQTVKQPSLMAQSAKQANVIAALTKTQKTTNVIQAKQVSVVKQSPSPKSVSAKQIQTQSTQNKPVQSSKPPAVQVKQDAKLSQVVKNAPVTVPTPHKSPLIKQRPLQKQVDSPVVSTPSVLAQQTVQTVNVAQPVAALNVATHNKLVQGTRSLLIKAPAVQTTVTAVTSTPTSQITPSQRRGIVRVLTPTTPTGGKSLISPRALLQQATPTTKKRTTPQESLPVTSVAQSCAATAVVTSIPTAVSNALTTRTVQLAGGRTVQLAANQTVHLPGGQAVQLSSGHTLQLSSLQLPTHSVRLPSGQTVQLASTQAIRAVNTIPRAPSPRQQTPTIKTAQTSAMQIPISTVQLAGQTVQIGGHTVQLAGQSVQLTGHTVKLPSGQSVQVASPSLQSVQLPSGQTVQLASGVQTVQLGQNVLTNPPAGTLQTVQLPGGQTLQLASGQTVQFSGGQTIQLGGQTVQLAGQSKVQASRPQVGDKPAPQPIVAKLLTNAQGQVVSLEGRSVGMSGVRVISPATTARATRPLLLTPAKPLHNVILQQSDGSIRMSSSGGASTSQNIVLGNLGQTATTASTTTPILKLQQVNQIQQVKLAQGIKFQQGGGTSATPVRSVVMDAQQLKLVGGRHVLARILRPAPPPPPPH